MKKKFYRSRNKKMISGVCAGIANYFNIDVTLTRIIAVVATIVSHGLVAIIYLVLALLIPEEAQPVYQDSKRVRKDIDAEESSTED